MSTSKLQATLTATYDGWNHAMEQLREAAERLNLEIVGWGAIPKSAPKIKVDQKLDTWDCPHCGEAQGELELAMDDNTGITAQWVGDKWLAYPDTQEVKWIAAYCLNCNGWVQPEDTVELS